MNEESLMCPICGGLHPAGHRDKELEDRLESIKNDLVEWSRHHDPPEQEKQINLWCSMNRLIGDHFGTDWMERSGFHRKGEEE